jgi:hypothetical protein
MRPPLFSLLVFALASAAPAYALAGGRDDDDTAFANATVSIDNGNCTGVLIAPQLVMTAGHCGSGLDTAGLEEIDGTFVPAGQWWRFRTRALIGVSPDPSLYGTDNNYVGFYTTQAGWADIRIIMLDRPVPASQAAPVRPLTRLTAAQRTRGFWSTQSFTVAGFGGGRARRQVAEWSNGVYPCKNTPIAANDEFICGLDHRGASLESGDSGGPLYWTDPATHTRYVVGIYQGNAQYLRLCPTDGSVTCSNQTFRLLRRTGDCLSDPGRTFNLSAWAPMHHTATFFDTGRCWTDAAGVTRHQPNIGQWIDDVMRWGPTAGDALMPVVLQRTSGVAAGFVISPYQGNDVDPTITSAILVNAHAPNFWSWDYWTITDKVPLWGWRVDGTGRTLYTTEFLGHTFSRPTLGRLHLSSPGLVGYLWPTPTSYTGHLIPLSLFTNADESDYVTTWDLPAMFPDPAQRAQWRLVRTLGYVLPSGSPLSRIPPDQLPQAPNLPPIRLPPSIRR